MKSKGVNIYMLPKSEKERWLKAVVPLHEEWLTKMESKGYKNIREMLKTTKQLIEKYKKK